MGFLRGSVDYSKSSMKEVILLSLNGLKIHLLSLLSGSFRISFLDGQRHLNLLLLPHERERERKCVCVCEGHVVFKSFIGKHHIRSQICTEEEDEEMEVEVFPSV